MSGLVDREIVVSRRRYRVAIYPLPSRARWRAEAAEAGHVVESVDAIGNLAARIGIRRRLVRRQQH